MHSGVSWERECDGRIKIQSDLRRRKSDFDSLSTDSCCCCRHMRHVASASAG